MQSQNSVFTPAARYGGEQNVQERSDTERELREGGRERKGESGPRRSFVALDPANLSGTASRASLASSEARKKKREEPTQAC